jgi:hypothetical protein
MERGAVQCLSGCFALLRRPRNRVIPATSSQFHLWLAGCFVPLQDFIRLHWLRPDRELEKGRER